MTEEMLEVRAALNPDTNEPLYGTCTLSVGDGSVKVEFKNGRAVAPRSVVERYLVNNGALEVPALGIFRSRISEGGGAVAQSQESVTATGTKALEDMTPEERIEAALRLSELIAADQGGTAGEEEAEEPASTDDTSSEDPPEETEKERRIREAKEHLKEEGEEVPEVEEKDESEEDDAEAEEPAADESAPAARVVPAGFDDLTAEGEPRCLAKKGDKTQCKNAAKDGGPACQLEAHAKQFAA